ncbi:MAG: OsmC family protein [Betaproteobacteria bacterium]|nr:OsmC family protein [Betaproteobacteria bacterium]
MSEHQATVEWARQGEFKYETYRRQHVWRFEGGIIVPGSAAPANIPKTAPSDAGVDPEQAFVASLSSCHMLWFLHLACNRKYVIDRYVDEAVGVLDKDWMSKVTLRPRVTFSGKAPSEEEHRALHHKAHEKCFIANSVKTEVVVEPSIVEKAA